jgi:hypothetical protein
MPRVLQRATTLQQRVLPSQGKGNASQADAAIVPRHSTDEQAQG